MRRFGWTVKSHFGNREAGEVGKVIWRLGACYTAVCESSINTIWSYLIPVCKNGTAWFSDIRSSKAAKVPTPRSSSCYLTVIVLVNEVSFHILKIRS
jgi:hypothetical protein